MSKRQLRWQVTHPISVSEVLVGNASNFNTLEDDASNVKATSGNMDVTTANNNKGVSAEPIESKNWVRYTHI